MEKIQNPGSFQNAIRDFNAMYGLPTSLASWKDSEDFAGRIQKFQSILSEEVEEGREILLGPDPLAHATALCDWLGDLMVYCASEATKYDAFPDLRFSPSRETLDPLLAGINEVAQRDAGQDIAMIVRVVEDHAKRFLNQGSQDPHLLPVAITDVAVAGFTAFAKRYQDFDFWAILDIIMASNFSKLGADGKPIYDDRGKVLKGPGYWKPEPKISAYLSQRKPFDHSD